MRTYPVMESELHELAWIGVGATAAFSLGLSSLGFAVDLARDMAFAPEMPRTVLSLWQGVLVGAGVFSFSCMIVGAILFLYGKRKIKNIKDETRFS